MRRLTLILSDLYLPADAVRESFPTVLELPALQGLLRFAEPPRRIGDWRTWLARELSLEPLVGWPCAHVMALAAGIAPAGTWLATPVSLEARLDHVRLADRGMLRLSLAQLADLAQEFAIAFGPESLITASTDRALLFKGGPAVDLQTVDPARLLDADVGSALPSGNRSGDLRRLSAEIEMWLPGTRTNAARERAGLRKVTALWFWGGGSAKQKPTAPVHAGSEFHLSGNDPFLAALNILLAKDALRPTPAGFGDIGHIGEPAAVFVEVAPMSGPPGESLPTLDENWFAPARDALTQGRLECVQIVANDRVFTVRPRASWKFWRRRRGWLESLA